MEISITQPKTILFGRCPCGGIYEKKIVEVRYTQSNEQFILRDVPQGACPTCGSRVYKSDILERIEFFYKLTYSN